MPLSSYELRSALIRGVQEIEAVEEVHLNSDVKNVSSNETRQSLV